MNVNVLLFSSVFLDGLIYSRTGEKKISAFFNMSFAQLIVNALGGSGATSSSGLSEIRSFVDAKFGKGSDSEIAQWLSVARSISSADFDAINIAVEGKTYLAGGAFGIADAALYVSLATSKDASLVTNHRSLTRYISHVQSLCKPQAGITPFIFHVSFTTIPVGCGWAVAKVQEKHASNKASVAEAAPEIASASEKKDKKATPAAAAATPAPPAPPAEDDIPEPSMLDMRVGVVVKCWNHEGSEKILCEEIDCGEAAPRSIASGIRAFYNADALVGRKVIVLANLKARTIANFKSEGMVLCACNEDHSKVAILEPPADAKAGDRVVFAGFEGKEAAQPNAMAKKKILEKLSPLLKTDAKGVAFCGKDQFLVNGKAVTSAMSSAAIS